MSNQMNKALKALERIYKTSYPLYCQIWMAEHLIKDYNVIKEELEDKENKIKELEEVLRLNNIFSKKGDKFYVNGTECTVLGYNKENKTIEMSVSNSNE